MSVAICTYYVGSLALNTISSAERAIQRWQKERLCIKKSLLQLSTRKNLSHAHVPIITSRIHCFNPIRGREEHQNSTQGKSHEGKFTFVFVHPCITSTQHNVCTQQNLNKYLLHNEYVCIIQSPKFPWQNCVLVTAAHPSPARGVSFICHATRLMLLASVH